MQTTPQPNPEVLKHIEDTKLSYVSDQTPGFSRVKHGKGFVYLDEKGEKITDPNIRARIESLAIPPAWIKVWICPRVFGHIQALGYDKKGRKQYIYHPEWSKIMQENKFHKLLFFSQVLPHMRKEIYEGMNDAGLTYRRILSTVIFLLQKTFVRVGNKEYAEENESYGLTTLRMKHVDVVGNTVKFEFRGKSGKFQSVEVEHPRVARTIRKLEELPGYELFQYIDGEGNRHVIDSSNVNEYLKKITGDAITAKDFRTWGGTVYAAESLYTIGPFENKTQAKKNIASAVEQVSEHLKNTTTVCRCYYIHPTVIETYQKAFLIPHFDEARKNLDKKPEYLHVTEYATSTLLKKYSS